MNLLNLLLKSLLTDSSVSALGKKTGLSTAVLKKLIPLAVPLLIKFLTNNASSQSGALSLLGALTQHTEKKSLAEQIDESDMEDGSKILGHIFGSQADTAIGSLAQQSGLSTQDVSTALAGIAPAVMSSLSAATSSVTAKPAAAVDLSDGFDLTDLIGLFGGASAYQSQTAGGGLLSGLLGGGSGGLGGGLLGSLLGTSAQQADQDNSVNGTQLLSLLSALR